METSALDLERQRGLRKMKALAVALLLVAAVVYVITKIDGGDGWVGYVVAFFEAAMVGALADWFAVTALFRHPLGVPIPHTAIIPNRKEQIGRSLGDFVQQNFLNGEVLGAKLHDAGLAARLGTWLGEPVNAERVGAALGDSLGGLSDAVAGENLRAAVNETVLQQARATPVAPLVGRGIDLAIEGGHHTTLFDAILRGAESFLDEQRTDLRGRLDQESPWWVPEPIDDRIFDKIYNGVTLFLARGGRRSRPPDSHVVPIDTHHRSGRPARARPRVVGARRGDQERGAGSPRDVGVDSNHCGWAPSMV